MQAAGAPRGAARAAARARTRGWPTARRCCARRDAAGQCAVACSEAASCSRQRPTISVMELLPGTQVPALGVAADQEHKLELRHEREQAGVPGAGALPPRRQVAAGRVVARESRTPWARWRCGAGRRTPRGVTPSQARSRSPEGSVKGLPEACTRTPGAWLQMQMRAVVLGRSTGRGSCGSGCSVGRIAADAARLAPRAPAAASSAAAPRSYVEHEAVLGQHARAGRSPRRGGPASPRPCA